MAKNSKNIKIMADLLRQGATLTEHACPACSSPIFKMRSGYLCLESTIMTKIQEIEKQLAEETNVEQIKTLGATLSTLLENLEKIRNIKK